jgi:hypothetical protein
MRVIRNDAYVLEAAKTITGATAANPVVITSASHGYSNGDEVSIADVVGMTELNGQTYIVANQAANTFELTHQHDGSNIDGSAFTAYSSGGEASKYFKLTTPYTTADLPKLKYVQSADTMTLTHSSYTTRDLTRTGHSSWTLSEVAFVPTQDHPTGLTVTVNTSASLLRRYQVTAIKQTTAEESLPALNNTSQAITGATAANPVVLTVTGHAFADGDEIEVNSVVGMTELNGRRFTVANQDTNTVELMGIDGTSYTAYSSAGTANLTFVEITTSHATEDNTVAWTAVAGAFKYAIYRAGETGLYGLIGETGAVSFEDDDIVADSSQGPPRYADPFSEVDEYPGTSSYFEQRQAYGGSVNKPDTATFARVADRTDLSAAVPARSDDSFAVTLNALQVNEIRHFVPLNDLIILTSGAEWRVNSGPDTAFELTSIRMKPQSYWGCSHLQPHVIGNVVFFMEENDAVMRSLGYSFQQDVYTGTNMGLFSEHMLRKNTVSDWAIQHATEQRVYMVRDDGKILTMTFDQEQEVVAWTTWDTDGTFENVTALKHSPNEQNDKIYVITQRTINGNTVRYVEKVNHVDPDFSEDAFFIDSGLSLDVPITITGSTAANPVVITATSHGLSDGDLVDINGIVWEPNVDKFLGETQPTQVTGRYKVANKTANTFELNTTGDVAIDGSAYNAYKSGGKVRLAVTTVSGLDHLEGETLVALANGNVVRGLVVSSGSVTFSRAYSRIHIGMPYITDIETLNVEAPQGTVQGVKKKITKVTVKFDRSRGMVIGPTLTDANKLVEMKQREFEGYGVPTGLLTGAKSVILKPDWNSNGRIAIRQKDPLPLNVLAIVPDVEVGDI